MNFSKKILLNKFFKTADADSDYGIFIQKLVGKNIIYKKVLYIKNKEEGLSILNSLQKHLGSKNKSELNLWMSKKNDVLSITFGKNNLYTKYLLEIINEKCIGCEEVYEINHRDFLEIKNEKLF